MYHGHVEGEPRQLRGTGDYAAVDARAVRIQIPTGRRALLRFSARAYRREVITANRPFRRVRF